MIKGYVITAGTGTPVRRAQVRAASMEGGGGVTSTDAEGRFEIRALPAGRYNVMVNKAGYVMAYYGQRRPNEPGTPLELGDGQTAEKVGIQLSRGAVISGRIVDDNGEPVAGTQVAAMRQQSVGGTRRMMPGGSEGSTDRTDDQGGFRLYGLAPGEYFVITLTISDFRSRISDRFRIVQGSINRGESDSRKSNTRRSEIDLQS